MSNKKTHILHIRKLDHETYITLCNLKKKMKSRSWAIMMKKFCDQYREEIEEFEWL